MLNLGSRLHNLFVNGNRGIRPRYWGSLVELSSNKINELAVYNAIIRQHKKRIMEGYIIPIGQLPEKGNWSAIIFIHPDYQKCTCGYLGVYKNGAKSHSNKCDISFLSSKKHKVENIFDSRDILYTHRGELSIDISDSFGARIYRITPV